MDLQKLFDACMKMKPGDEATFEMDEFVRFSDLEEVVRSLKNEGKRVHLRRSGKGKKIHAHCLEPKQGE